MRDTRTDRLRFEPDLVRWIESAVVVAGLVILVTGLFFQPDVPLGKLMFVGYASVLALIVAAIATARRRASPVLRRSLLLVYIFGYCGLSLALVGPRIGIGAGMMAAVVVATTLLGRRGVVGSAAAIFVIVALAGVAFLEGWLTAVAWNQEDLGGWVRMALMCGTVALLVGLGSAEIASRIEAAFERTMRMLQDQRREQTDRQTAQRALDVAARAEALGRLAGGIAHDVNNSLAVILTNAQLLEEGLERGGDERQLVTAMIDATQRAARTTRDVLAFGRGTPEQNGTVEAAEVLPSLGEFLQRIVPETVTIDISCESDRYVPLSSAAFHQVVLFAILELVDALDRDAALSLTIRDHGGGTELCVRGVARGRLGDIAESSPSFIAIAASVARRGGEVVVRRGGGALELLLRFPAADAPRPSDSGRAERVVRRVANATTRVLVVDDEHPVRRAIARVVRNAGYTVVEAHDETSARRACDEAEFDLLLTDAVMPNTDTEALIAHFREQHPGSPVVVCSGFVREELIHRGIAAGEYDFIAKPFVPEELTDLLSEVLERGAEEVAG